jgi:RND family efflux transporter MFP subunit
MSNPNPSKSSLVEADHQEPQIPENLENQVITPAHEEYPPEQLNGHSPRKLAFDKHKRKWIIGLIGAVVLLVGGFLAWQWWQSRQGAGGQSPAAQQQPQGVPVRLATVERQTVQDSTEYTGTLDADQSVALKAEVNGQVRQIYVQAGTLVEQGDIIARIENEDTQAQLRQARAAQQRAEARLNELQAGNRPEEIARARASVAAAQARLDNALAGASPEEIAQAQAQLESAQAEQELAQQQVRRYAELVGTGAIAENTYDEFRQKARSAEARVREAQRRLAEVRQTRQSDIQELQAEFEEQQQALQLLERGTRPESIAQAEAQVAEAVAQVRNIEALLARANVVAPFAGKIGDVPVKLGEYVAPGDEITTVTQNDSLALEMQIPLERSSELKLGMPVELSDANGQPIATGEISFVSPRVNQTSQSVLAKASFENPQGKLLDGQFVRAKVIWEQRANTIAIPTTAVIFQGEERFVFVAQGQEPTVAKRVPVKLGIIQGDRAEILEGLQPTDKIVVSGLQKLSDGVPIMALPDEQSPAQTQADSPVQGNQEK